MAYYSIHEAKKPEPQRVYHDDETCPAGREIPAEDRHNGTNGYRLCRDCMQRGKKPQLRYNE